jgi:hypothetical protein
MATLALAIMQAVTRVSGTLFVLVLPLLAASLLRYIQFFFSKTQSQCAKTDDLIQMVLFSFFSFQVLFIALKIDNRLDWPWLTIFAFFWIFLAVYGLFLLYVSYALLGDLMQDTTDWTLVKARFWLLYNMLALAIGGCVLVLANILQRSKSLPSDSGLLIILALLWTTACIIIAGGALLDILVTYVFRQAIMYTPDSFPPPAQRTRKSFSEISLEVDEEFSGEPNRGDCPLKATLTLIVEGEDFWQRHRRREYQCNEEKVTFPWFLVIAHSVDI